MYVDRHVASEADIVGILEQCIDAKTLWFSITYELFGESRIIRARELLAYKDALPEDRERFLNQTAQDIKYADSVKILFVRPDALDSAKLY